MKNINIKSLIVGTILTSTIFLGVAAVVPAEKAQVGRYQLVFGGQRSNQLNTLFEERHNVFYRIDTTDGSVVETLQKVALPFSILGGEREEPVTKPLLNSVKEDLRAGLNAPKAPAEAEKRAAIVEIADPIVEKAIRKKIAKPFGELTKPDFEKVKSLNLSNTQITDAGLKEVAKLTRLNVIVLNNTEVTLAGVAELQKALPMCLISHNATK